MKKKFKKITTKFPTIEEMEWDIHTLKTSKEIFEYLTEAFWLHDELTDYIDESNIEKTHMVSSVLLAFEHLNQLIDRRISYVESMIEQACAVEIRVEDENENSLLN